MLTKKQQQNGFTIVELLIVIVVIAILAAITIVAYNGIQARAQAAAIQSDLSAVVKKTELYKINGDSNLYPNSMGQLQAAELSFSKDAYTWVLYCTDTTSYIYAARMINTSRWWIGGSSTAVAESTAPGTSGSSATTCNNLGYPTTTYAGWIKSNSGWSL